MEVDQADPLCIAQESPAWTSMGDELVWGMS